MPRDVAKKPAAKSARGSAPPAGDYFLTDFVPYLVNRVASKFNQDFIKDVRARKLISISQWRVIAVLHARPGLSLNEIVGHVTIDQPTLSRIVDQLIALGLVWRAPRPGDGRFVSISLTPQGLKLFEEIWPLSVLHTRRGTKNLSEREEKTLVTLLRKVLANLDEG